MNSTLITREIMGNVPAWLGNAFYVLAFTACGWAALGFGRRFLSYRKARPASEKRRRPAAGVVEVIKYLTFHKKLLDDRFAGIAHLCTVYGFIVLFIGTCIVFVEHRTPLHFFHGTFYLWASMFIDVFGAIFIVGVSMFLWRRHSGRCERILANRSIGVLAWLLLVIAITGFLLEAARIAVDMPRFERWSVVGYSIAMVMHKVGISGTTATALHSVLWGGHAVVCVAFFALLPWLFFSHIVYGPISWATRNQTPIAQLRTPQLTQQEPGANTLQALEWPDLLHADACTTCGRCNAECPASASGKPLAPRDIVLGIRNAVDDTNSDHAPKKFSARFADDVLWSCTTCGACSNACPVGIDVYGKIVELRRGRVENGSIPESAETVFESTAAKFNPFGRDNNDRLSWTQGLQPRVAEPGEAIELLYWIGCSGSFDPDGQSVSRAMITILETLQIDYRILGKRECCTGDPARRMGEEGLFQDTAKRTIKLLDGHDVKKVITHCPHCFNAFKNEYPELGGNLEVEHHSQFLNRLMQEGRLPLVTDTSLTTTYHDPCYLGRGNSETDAPRELLDAIAVAGRREMPRHGKQSFCCGAGGGAMWLDVKGSDRVENIRAREAAETGADTVVTGCPFCKGMLEAGRQSLADDPPIQVKDLAEVVVEHLQNG